MKVDIDTFSGYKIYPGTGITYVRIDSRTFRFFGSKEKSLFLQRKNPRKISWTQVYRRSHRKGITEEVAKKRSRKTVKAQRGIVGADLASIMAKRNQKPEVRDAQRAAALQKAKEEKKAEEAKKKKSAPTQSKTTAPKVSKQQAKGASKSAR